MDNLYIDLENGSVFMVLGSGLFVAPISNDGKVLREEWEPAYVNDEFTQAEFDRITQVLTC